MSCQPTPTPCSDCTQTLLDISNLCTDECIEKVASKCVYYDGEPITTSVMHITTNESLTDIIKELTKNSADLAVDLTYNATTRQLCLTKNGSPVRCFTIAETGYYMVLTADSKLQLWRQVLPSGPDVKVDEEDLSFSFADPSVHSIADLGVWDRKLHGMVFVRDWLRGGWFSWNGFGNTDNISTYDALGGGYWIRNNSYPGFANVCWGGCNPSFTASQNTTIIQSILDAGYKNIDIPGGISYTLASLTSTDAVRIGDAGLDKFILGSSVSLRFLADESNTTKLDYGIRTIKDINENGISISSQVDGNNISPRLHLGGNIFRILDNRFTLNSAYGHVDGAYTTPAPKTDGSTTADIRYGNIVVIADSTATSFTNFVNGYAGMIVTCYFTNSNTTLVHSNSLKLGGSNIKPIVGSSLSFYMNTATTASLIGSYNTLRTATSNASGDGATTTFHIAHGLGTAPQYYTVTPTFPDAASPFYVTVDNTNLNIIYLTAPESGSSNLGWNWGAKL